MNSGTHNLLIHLRGHKKDFDNWANITGDPSWSWEGVLPYFKSYEDYEIPGDDVNHGYRGELRVEAPDYLGRGKDFVAAANELGYRTTDLNAPFDEGFDIIRYAIKNGVRQAPYKAFLEPIRSRSTLTIMKFAHVNKILFKNGNKAFAVQYDKNGRTYVAEATREVIVSTGTVQTSKLLMLSGIGPKTHLQELNIPVVSDLPVGSNLHDHIAVYLAPFFIKEGLGNYVDRDYTVGEFVKWFTLGRGVLSSSGCEASGLISSEIAKARGEGNWPDIQLFQYSFTNFGLGTDVVSKSFNLKLDEMTQYMKNDIGRDALFIGVQGSRPLSRGYVKLGGSSPYDKPIIDPNYLGDPDGIDFKVLLEGVKKSLYLMENTTASQRIGSRFTTTRLPVLGVFYTKIFYNIASSCGTAAIGSVVDTQLRVIGTENLRVVDASVQPVVVSTNTQASTLMIAEKGADMILKKSIIINIECTYQEFGKMLPAFLVLPNCGNKIMVVPVEVVVDNLNTIKNAFLQPVFVPILYLSLQLLPVILTLWTTGDRTQDENEFKNPFKPKTYDFIVVGGGSAGSVVANRLSRNYNVLLLEQGGDPNPIQFIPAFGQFLLNFPETDFSYRAVPQKYASQGCNNQQTSLSAGLGLGGSGTLNIMIHLRGHTMDFNTWAAITGDPSWSWDGVLPFFKSYEDYEIPGDNVNHGYTGELRIEAPDSIGTAPEFIQAAKELGFPNVDLNAPFYEGFDVIRYPIKGGIRQATYKAFIEPILTRFSLRIMKYAQVNKVLSYNLCHDTARSVRACCKLTSFLYLLPQILFKAGHAYAIKFERHGQALTAYASKEIIISAGAYGSSKLLMLSGIGPKAHLQEYGIPVLSDLPVGHNLKDHIAVLLSPFTLTQPRSLNLERDATISEFVKWFTLGRGRFTSSGAEASGHIASSFAKVRGEGNWPDIQLMHACFAFSSEVLDLFAHAFNLKIDVAREYYSPVFGQDACHTLVVAARPYSKGYIKLGGDSPSDRPIIQPNYLDPDTVDAQVLLEGVKRTLVLLENTTAFGVGLGARFPDLKLPGCEHFQMRSDEYWACFIRHWTISVHHPSGTAAMGSVVDNKLRVMGVRNLRVVDNSVAPEHVSANPQASVLMIAEKASAMILQEWKNIELKTQEQQQWLIEQGRGSGIGIKPMFVFKQKRGVMKIRINKKCKNECLKKSRASKAQHYSNYIQY
ncbi:Glucose dehydrogenase [FAD, quinone] [Orchesella cincta]|uniref:Glucose dehydrogenase [FAD, quinone] n=1 Tax=Orchesella cincta TaxID=48709 RepID=A0A1D2NEE3_ORCCI|nr:Glucose dehydrogenase [FAD, quinone] [Orchesella cincta]